MRQTQLRKIDAHFRSAARDDARTANFRQRGLTANSLAGAAQRKMADMINNSPRQLAQRKLIDGLCGDAAGMPALQAKASAAQTGLTSTTLTGGYRDAFNALTQQTSFDHQPRGAVFQMELTGAYADAAVKIGSYMGKTAARAAEAILQEASDLGFAAPNLAGHMTESSGKDDKGEKERQKQINAKFKKWKIDFAAFKARKKDEDEDEDGAAGGAVSSSYSGARTESRREEYKQQRATEKRDAYKDSQRYEYIAPWHGGPSAW